MNPNLTSNLVRFGAFELDLRARELRKGGLSIGLPEQSIKILALMLEKPGEVVLREEIRKKLWPNDTVVEFDHSINAAIKRLRQALEDPADAPQYIETLARRGYRWKIPAESVDPQPQNAGRAEADVAQSGLAVGGSLIGKKVSHYRVLEVLGGGGMGVVFKAEDLKLGRRVALKFLPPETANDPLTLRRFEQEARAASALNHPNICTIYGIEEHEGQPFIVMEFLEGETLRELIPAATTRKVSLPLERLLDLAVQVTHGLDVAHQKGIIHRDIKPANIFVTTQGQAKILDFGLAKLVLEFVATDAGAKIEHLQNNVHGTPGETETAVGSDLLLSRTGVAMGTAGYMSPEQVRGEKLDVRTDLFSFGLVLYEMATGQQPFTGDTAPELHDAILTHSPVPARQLNPALPPKLEAIINRALEKDREARYQSASEVRADLETLKREIEPKDRARWRETAAAGVVAVGIIASATFWFARRQPQSPSVLPEIKFRQLTSNSSENGVQNGAISPDGRYLAYTDKVGMHLKLIETGETQTVPQPDELKSNFDWEIGPWFPDGTRFLADAHPLGLDATQVTSRGSGIWTVSVLGGPPKRLRDEAYPYSISPDGSLISFGTNKGRFGDREIWVMRPDGELARKLFEIDENGAIGGLEWSPDGQRVLYEKVDEEGQNLVSRDLMGGPPVTILSPPEAKSRGDFLWLPDGRLIYSLRETDQGRDTGTCNYWQLRIDPRSGESVGKPRRVTNWAGFCAVLPSVTSDSKRLVFREVRVQTGVYVADLQASGTRLTVPTRLTLEEGWNDPLGWTADSKAVLFVSNRDGAVGLFKQSLDQETAEPLIPARKEGGVDGACLSPEGSWVFYMEEGHPSPPDKLMRVPITGGSPQLVLTANFDGGPRCARSPATLCAMGERSSDLKQLVFKAFDPVKGRGRELAELQTDAKADYYWDLSPDGTRIAILGIREGRIQILSLKGRTPQEVTVKGWNILTSAVWTADGKGLFVSSYNERGAVLLGVDLQGNARLLWGHKGGVDTDGVPSPDGRHLAMRGWNADSNMWMMENF